MKKWTRLKPLEAHALGFEIKQNGIDGRSAKYRLDENKLELLIELRSKGIIDSCDSKEVDPTTVKHLWKKDKESSVFVKNPLYIEPEIKSLMDSMQIIHEKSIKELKQYAFKYPKFKREKTNDPHCLVFDAADIHIGKICSSFETGETYDSQIAVQRVRMGLHGILNKAKGFTFDKVIFIAGNDILHIDNPKRTTTSGTPQDTDGMWYDNFMMAKGLLIEVIETLLTVADVEVVFNPSNHDFTHGFMLLDSVSSWFHNCKQITFNNDMSHRKYTIYGENLIGSTHMDGAKVDKLHGLMAEEAGEHWHKCKHRYFYGHHIHHKTSKDFFSVCIETLRSPSGTDGWHHRNGYQHAPKAVEAFIHHPTQGQVSRITHLF